MSATRTTSWVNPRRERLARLMMLAAVMIAPAAHAEAPAPGELGAVLEAAGELSFRQGLRDRGLLRWLEQERLDHPPSDPIERALAERDVLLDEAARPETTPDRRAECFARAGEILERLLTEHPDAPGALGWRLAYVRDLLERSGEPVFAALLLYELPGRDRQAAHDLAVRTLDHSTKLFDQIAETWKAVEALDEITLERLTASGTLQGLERMEAQAAVLRAWAALYEMLAGPVADRRATAESLLKEVVERRRWTQLPEDQAEQRLRGLLLATIAARGAGQFSAAESHARQLVAFLPRAGQTLGARQAASTALLTVLEQVRALRDAGKRPEARAAADQAAAWVARTQPGELSAQLAVALLQRSLLAAELSPTTQPIEIEHVLAPAAALQPLESLLKGAPSARDTIYATLAGAVAAAPLPPSSPENALAWQLLLGGLQSGREDRATASRPATQPSDHARLSDALRACEPLLTAADLPPERRGELLFLAGRGNARLGQSAEAIDRLCGVLELPATHDRADTAVRLAFDLARTWLRDARSHERASARTAFLRAARHYRRHLADAAAWTTYYIASVLEAAGDLPVAADEYARVSDDDPNALHARLGEARCLRKVALLGDADPAALLPRALKAAEAAAAIAPADADPCLRAQAFLLRAGLLNTRELARPAEAIAALDAGAAVLDACPDAAGAAMRERIVALRELKRLAEARQVVTRYLEQDPAGAGPVMLGLLSAMRQEMDAAADRGDVARERELAAEAVELAEQILSTIATGRLSDADRQTVRLWRAGAIFRSGDAAAALKAFDELRPHATQPAVVTAFSLELQLGRAECLLALERPTEALPLFAQAWAQSPESGPFWWRAYAGMMRSHLAAGSPRDEILKSIQQQRRLHPDLGGPRWSAVLGQVERQAGSPESAPAGPQS